MHPDTSSTPTENGNTTPSTTSIYSRYRLPRNARTDDSSPTVHKRSFTVDSLSSVSSSAESIASNSWTSTATAATLTPSAAIRNQYYHSHQYLQDSTYDIPRNHQRLQSEESLAESSDQNTVYDDGEDLAYRPGTVYYAPLRPSGPPSLRSFSDAGSIISLRTEYGADPDDTKSISSMRTMDSFREDIKVNRLAALAKKGAKISRSGTIFKSKSGSEPKIVVQDGWADKDSDRSSVHTISGGSLLSRLSRSTAPMRAKLAAFSRTGQLKGLRAESTNSLSLPLRRSAESVYNMPVTPRRVGHRANGERSQSFSYNNESPEQALIKERASVVYPALLSKVAEALKERITTGTKIKDSIEYKDAFDGKEVVDKLAYLIKTTDRNVALVLGRALDAQKLFHDVNYEHRLRDSVHELYQFKDRLNVRPHSRFIPPDEDTMTPFDEEDKSEVAFHLTRHEEEEGLPNGVFTVLTDCYSPTCTRDELCYSVFCPRRLEQQEERLWIKSVPQEIADKLSKEEKKRQENIFELIYTEKDFVDDLAYVQKFWITPIREASYFSPEQREEVVKIIFWNIMAVHSVNAKLAKALEKRQAKDPVVHEIGDIMLEYVGQFQPFVDYGAHQIISKHRFEVEKSTSPEFAKFVEMTERLPQSRKLELNGYLTKPTSRLGRYNLLLREILKHTPKDHPDQENIPKTQKIIAEFLSNVNHETGKQENDFNLKLLDEKLSSKRAFDLDLDLKAKHRQIIMKGALKKKESGPESSNMLVFLLDHCLLILKQKFTQNTERYKFYRKPIPLALLSISLPDQNKRASTVMPYGRSSTSSFAATTNTDIPPLSSNKSGYPISFVHLGKQGTGPVTLYASTFAGRRQWVETIEKQRQTVMEKQMVLDIAPISERFFSSFNKVKCVATFHDGKSLVFGSEQGVYLKQESKSQELVRILTMDKVSQVDILEGSDLILVLADKILYTYSLTTLLSHESGIKRGRKISSHVSFFKVGQVLDKTDPDRRVEKTLVCFVRFNAMTSTIRALEPCESVDPKKKSKHHLGRLIRGSNEVLRVYKDLYIPGEASSIQYFKNIICVGCVKGFQMVNINSAEVESVLDPTDEQNQVVLHRESMKPISMFKHQDGDILLCYNELAFYIDKKGRRAKDGWSMPWEGNPTAFAFHFPYIVAFDSTFIEVRHIDTGELLQVIPGNNIRCLRPDSTDHIYCVMDDRVSGSEVIFELKFVKQ
ncbi:RHO1 GDP-GTP exchange protein 2 [Apophysomyces sp. BC1034]|nr:RHO1 GDP-GTP exchange protein 2 [Apophysomyces sp. BC1015]KAG0175987.1 RHO1 GDP-GTP exchange protein 2 [Apophysomyces sp. BC1021]KAG0186489.1 RHO1 GDP-GTP exchange protein 2 [Apophysomyces sp. BC1034]